MKKRKISIFKCTLLAIYALNISLLVWGIMSYWNVVTTNGFNVGKEIADWNLIKILVDIFAV